MYAKRAVRKYCTCLGYFPGLVPMRLEVKAELLRIGKHVYLIHLLDEIIDPPPAQIFCWESPHESLCPSTNSPTQTFTLTPLSHTHGHTRTSKIPIKRLT